MTNLSGILEAELLMIIWFQHQALRGAQACAHHAVAAQ